MELNTGFFKHRQFSQAAFSENMELNTGSLKPLTEERKCRVITFAKLALSAMIILGWLFPDFVWDSDAVSVTDENGTDITEELSGQEIYDGIYGAENLEFSFSWR